MTIGHGHGHNQLKGDFLCWQTLLFFSNVNGIECYTNWAKFEQFSFSQEFGDSARARKLYIDDESEEEEELEPNPKLGAGDGDGDDDD